MGALIARLRSGAGLGRQRLLAYGGILLTLEAAIFLFLIAGTHGLIVPLEHPTTTDFASFYAAGSLVDSGTPAAAYDQAAHHAAEERATEPGIGYQFFYYPPVFLMLCAALARLPYLMAFIVFEAATLVLYLLVARRTVDEPGWAVVVPLLAFPSVFWTLGLGQNAFLTAALFGAALLLIDRRPVASGLLFGMLCYKPHFGLLIPVALAAGRRWQAFAAATASVAALVLLSALLFGWMTWHEFLTLALGSPATYESGRIDFAGFVSLFGAIRLLGGSPEAAYAGQAVVTLGAVLLVAVVWWRNLSLPVRAAALAAAAVAAIPVVLLYDLMLVAIAGTWLVRAGRESGFRSWEKATLAGLFIVPLIARNIGAASHIPLGPLVPIAMLALVYARARQEMAPPIAVPAPDDAALRDLGRDLFPFLGRVQRGQAWIA
jgi:alpha-1,2-mannosyltransferase